MTALNDTHGRPVSTSTTVASTTDEACPYCRTTDGVRLTSDTGQTQAWACDRCHTDWAFTVIRPNARAAVLPTDLGAAVKEIERLRWMLTQVIAVADDAPGLTDVELRDRLLALVPPVSMAGTTR